MIARVASEPTAMPMVSRPEVSGDRPKPIWNSSGSRKGAAPSATRSGMPPRIEARKVPWRRMLKSSTGSCWRALRRRYSCRAATPATAMATIAAQGSMPLPLISSAPSRPPKATAISSRPARSKSGTGPVRGASRSTNASASTIPSRPNGMLTRKIQRQDVTVTMKPPNSGPAMRPIAGGTVNQTIAATICAAGTVRSRIRRPTGTIIAPPMPCSSR